MPFVAVCTSSCASREGVCLTAHIALPIQWMGPGLAAGLRRIYLNDESRSAPQVRAARCVCHASVVLACIACVPCPQHMQRPLADFRTPATRRECRAAVRTNGVNTGGTAAAAAGVLSSVPMPSVRRPPLSACGGQRPARAMPMSEGGRDRHEGQWLGAGWAIGPGDLAIVGSLGALPWAGTRAMHAVRS
jgi:hypothetical protein